MQSVPEKWDEIYDVVVAGTGAGGLAAAVIAASRGAKVLIVEKAPQVGGTTKKSFGFMWVPNNHFMQELGIADPRDAALRYMARLSRPSLYDPTHETLGLPQWEFDGLAAHYDNAADAVSTLVSLGAIDVSHAAEFPDFYGHLEEDESPVGRTLFPTNGNLSPIGGLVLVQELHEATQRANIEIRFDTKLADLVTDDEGSVVGAVLGGHHDGLRVQARRGVIGATGSFAQNAELRQRYLDRPYIGTCAAPTNTGDFLDLTRSVGADFASMNLAMQTPILVERIEREGDDFRGSFVLPGDALIVVNRYGNRVCSETASYHDLGRAFFEGSESKSTYPNLPLIAIWDEDVHNRYGADALGNPVPAAGADPYWVITADTLEDLETEIAKRLVALPRALGGSELDSDFGASLQTTLTRYAGFAASGIDEDFGRGSTPAQLALGGFFAQGSGVNPTMRALSAEGPYHAAILGPGLFETVGGAITDPHGRVVRADGTVVKGLYGVGTCVAGPWGEAAWSGGHNVAYALVSAYRAALHASGGKDDESAMVEAPAVAGR
ncbi:FAD binding domain-containing protein [Arthrobacter sp. SLBN-100]|uniref:FAD-dependent oxidoreductase n=1 Tax=Arthrobacter sp. SLBN-100 TaxID=2768450 RepID=UPI00114E69E5|nr:FAD-dependent oxidoreductase [Arthrobacter sp. SLBN-100]TQJ62214.1 FAD binding domain-containing protein [Arthrobacter sp. SLBN-100]